MKFEPLRDFFLVGGTALALRLGHRESVDLDLFTLETF
ncbi:MAG TPA: nucleotidyl transferase AbiEii/AbiGii toxin family protein, partial [Candidatus Cloacimonadota bacterium]|nr:nucleotidyl transferase AbiEii/AbiGii toxin family protein [Candidatus Cloacimonadota bacterium]